MLRAEGEPLYYKYLKLITPDKARELAVLTEAPIFVSGYINRKERCPHCGLDYSPVVYQSGYIIASQHFSERCGGIFFHGARSVEEVDLNIENPYGWRAKVTPEGETHMQTVRNTFWYSSRSVLVNTIDAECYGDEGIWHASLAGGIVIERSNSTLVPICSLEEHPQYAERVRYRFLVTDRGEIVFGKP